MKKFWIGIDIGKAGSICITERGSLPMDPDSRHLFKMPMIKTELDYRKLWNILEPYEGGNGIVCFEKLGVIFGTSKQTAFSMGHQAGAVEMVCVGLSIPFVKVPPKQWQKDMFTGITQITKKSKTGITQVTDTKAMALLAIQQLCPDCPVNFGGKATKPDDGLVDSILLSLYAKKNYP